MKDKKILVTGVKGQLGYDVVKELQKQSFIHVLGIDKDELDITDEKKVNDFIRDYHPDIVIHCAAYTSVDKAEEENDLAYKVNSLATKYIASSCKEIDATMLYISTDYVFDGKGDKFFETDDLKNGLSVYGKSKSEGEEYVKSILNKFFIVRISWVFGINGNNFVKTMIRLSESKKDKITVVDDQIGSPTYTKDLSVLIAQMIQTEKYGIYHATNEGVCSFFEFASQIMKMIKSKTEVVKISSEEYRNLVPNQAERPLNSRLSKKSLVDNGFSLLPDWKDALKRYIYDELKYIKE